MSVMATVSHRGLRGWCGPRYVDVRDQPVIRAKYQSVGDLIGIYQNPAGIEPDRILIAESGIYLVGVEGLLAIDLDDLVGVQLPADKHGPGILTVEHRDGHTTQFMVAGSDGRSHDVWRVGNTLRRAVELARDSG